MVVERQQLKAQLIRLLDYGLGVPHPANGTVSSSSVVTPQPGSAEAHT